MKDTSTGLPLSFPMSTRDAIQDLPPGKMTAEMEARIREIVRDEMARERTRFRTG